MKPLSLFRALASMSLVCLFAFSAPAQSADVPIPDGKAHRFEMHDRQFFLDGKPMLIVAGEMHFGRTLPEDWELRIKQAKAMGLNTLSFYLFWNLCEPREGEFSFNGMTDVRRLLKLCQENGIWAILRPGPYCCAEVDYGGIPWWTAKYPEVKIRTTDPRWLAWNRRYVEQVAKQIDDLQVTKGGPLLMVQIENEFMMVSEGNFSYLLELQKIFTGAGIEVPLFTCDPFLMPESKPGSLPKGVLRGRNGLRNDEFYEKTLAVLGDSPVFIPELYTAWFSGWGQPRATRYASVEQVCTWTSWALEHNISFCYYMFFGGTSYGFLSGTNEYLPMAPSYDYSAPVDEAGRVTEKYHALRAILGKRLGQPLPPVPPDPKVISLPAFPMGQYTPLLATLPDKPTQISDKPVSMEELDQDYGFVLYRKTFPDGLKGTLKLDQARDYTLVMINGRTVHRAYLGDGENTNTVKLDEAGPVTLDLLVHNLGRVSVITSQRSQNRARKGIVGTVSLDDKELRGWDSYSLPLASVQNLKASGLPPQGPGFYSGSFKLNEKGGTFLDMRNWSFGVVWVNGHNLGRFWDRGGVRSLFIPSQWLKLGDNQVVVLELHDAPKTAELSAGTKIIEEAAVPFAVRLDRFGTQPPPKRPKNN
jgi:beta-galactosidase